MNSDDRNELLSTHGGDIDPIESSKSLYGNDGVQQKKNECLNKLFTLIFPLIKC